MTYLKLSKIVFIGNKQIIRIEVHLLNLNICHTFATNEFFFLTLVKYLF